ncbi:MAG TPA: glycosyltransferase [Candidatus Thermoplasmatota archaeon]|nr:glycosyltransferase [Candidatus Thermoplasmatota archaeon]
MRPSLSVVVLTRNEAAHVREALASLLAQSDPVDEIVVVDAASDDATCALVREAAERDSRVRLIDSPRILAVGEARNLGVAASKGECVAFMSADAVADPSFAARVRASLRGADLVFGRQVHAPLRLTLAAAVRGLRYHLYERKLPAEAYASNVVSAARRELLERFPFGASEADSVLDDVLLARRAREAGLVLAYDPTMVVHHRDKATLASEYRKVRREARAWGATRRETGGLDRVVGWGALVLVALGGAVSYPHTITLALLALVLAAPALRRVTPGAFARYRGWALAAIAASPAYDLAFLFHYIQGAMSR